MGSLRLKRSQEKDTTDSNGDSNGTAPRLSAATGDHAHSRTMRDYPGYGRPERRTVEPCPLRVCESWFAGIGRVLGRVPPGLVAGGAG